ncbi:MAG TPA: adenylate/guanylate cyclase domain-containing protein [Candidatus Limnocylindrales bacterium]|nr:adenylate/guanylate cyclase domain-containing protein [Candidatus Limnocylindrales bacterium]
MDVGAAGAVTFLFTDLEGSTRLWEQFPDGMKAALRRHDAILRGAIEESKGRVVKTTGDGMMAVFEDPADAATASLTAQRGMALEAWADCGPLRVRMGVHAGAADQRADDFFGPTVNRTARIMAAGHGGQVLLSAAAADGARERLPSGAGLLDLGEHRLKDLGRPEHLFQLIHPDLASDFPPLSVVRPPGASLPSQAAAVVGRQVELKAVRSRLDDPSVRLLTLIGPGGTGKTTLAIRAADDLAPSLPDGVSFVDLSNARDTTAVLVAIARSIGLGDVIERTLLEELTDWLTDRRMLLVLDNFEQVTEAAGAVAQLLRDCPRLIVLVTSREALHVRAEHVYAVPPLGLPPEGLTRPSAASVEASEAVQLFLDRAQAVRPDFRLTDDNAGAIAEICRRLDGLPLAIELAAARLGLFSPEVLRDRLGDRLGLLRSGPRDLPERQQTLRATMDWSYDLLEAREQRLFEFLAVFADAEFGAIESVAAAVGTVDGIALDVLDGLGGLAEKSLIRQVDGQGGEPRVAMLETIREFAADRLDQRPDFGARVRRAHATYFADVAHGLRGQLTGNERETALATMAADVANLRIAWAFWVSAGDLEQLDKLADSLLILNDARGWYHDTVGLTSDMLRVLGAAASSPERVGQEIALRTSLARALMATKGVTQETEDAFTSAVELFERGANVGQQHSVLRGLASLYLFRGPSERAAELGAEILALGESGRHTGMRIDGHLLIGAHLTMAVDFARGLEHLDAAISLFTGAPTKARTMRVGNDPRVACYTTSAFTLWTLGYPDRAVERTDAALALAVELQHPFTSAFARFHAGLLRLWRRDPDVAHGLAVGLLEVAEEHGFRIWTAAGSCLLGAARVGLGRIDEGLADIRTGMELYQELRSPPVFWPFLLFVAAGASHAAGRPADGLGPLDIAIEILSPGSGATMLPELHVLKGDLLAAVAADEAAGRSDAEPWYRRALDRAIQLNARMTQLRAATRLGRLRVAEGQPDAAERLLGPIYATFTEGFATADLVEARELLAAVSGAPSAG